MERIVTCKSVRERAISNLTSHNNGGGLRPLLRYDSGD